MSLGSHDQYVVQNPSMKQFGSRDSRPVHFGSCDHEPVQSHVMSGECLEFLEDVAIRLQLPGPLAKGLHLPGCFQVDILCLHVEFGGVWIDIRVGGRLN